MVAKIIDGKAFAEGLRTKIAAEVAKLKEKTGKVPGLAVIQVGEDPASSIYVRNKGKATVEAGMNSFEFKLPADVSQEKLLAKIQELNKDKKVQGILVQLPLPAHINKDVIIEAVAPEKDVDGFHPANVEKLEKGEEGFVPCTPLGCMILLKDSMGSVAGKNAVVMGRSAIVGKPMAELLRKEGCKVDVIHSKTTLEDRAKWLKQADIIVVAVGKPKILSGKEIKKGAVVIDVGINRGADGKLIGDVDFQSCLEVASVITPVPGGVGPMTIACLLQNTLQAFKNS